MDEDDSEQRRPGDFRRPNGRHIPTPPTRPRSLPVDSSTPSWKIEAFVADDGTVPFQRFASGLSDLKFDALDVAVERVLAVKGLDLVRTE
jgi:hypothetical protein